MAAEAEKIAAADRAAAVQTEAEAEAGRTRITAEGDAQAATLRAEAERVAYAVRAEGERAVNEASNVLSPDQIAMQIKKALIEALPAIIEQQVKPMERIEGIKILHVDGLNGAAGGAPDGGGVGIADQAVDAALRYRTQAPLLDALMKELGLEDGALNGLAQDISNGAARQP